MEAMRNHWTDDRLDDLSQRMDEGFNRVDADLRELRREIRDQGKDLRAEMAEMGSGLRVEMADLGKSLRTDTADLGNSLRTETNDLGKSLRAETADLGKSLRGEMSTRFDALDARFDAMQRLLIQVAGALIAAFLAGLLGLIATQL
jgi:hypothetical protein